MRQANYFLAYSSTAATITYSWYAVPNRSFIFLFCEVSALEFYLLRYTFPIFLSCCLTILDYFSKYGIAGYLLAVIALSFYTYLANGSDG